MSVDTLAVPHLQPHLRSPSPPAVLRNVAQQTAKPLQVATAIDTSSRRNRPSRQLTHTNSGPQPRPASTKKASDFNVRPMTTGDFAAVAALMRAEGWNVNFDTMAAVFQTQPNGYFVAEAPDGEIAGHISSLCLDEEVGMLSYILVSSQHQKRGLGSRLMETATKALKRKTVLFYSVEDAVPFYKARSFDTRRFSALVRDFSLHSDDFTSLPENKDIKVVRAQDVDLEEMNRYDSSVHGIDRPGFLRRSILKNSNVTFAALDSQSGHVVGYVSLSFWNGRWDVAPLYADSDDIALQLLKKASLEIAEPIRAFVRIPADSSNGIKLFNKLRDVQHHRVLYLMSDSPLPADKLSSDKVYSLSTVCYGLK